jgi:hypothetical protein
MMKEQRYYRVIMTGFRKRRVREGVQYEEEVDEAEMSCWLTATRLWCRSVLRKVFRM